MAIRFVPEIWVVLSMRAISCLLTLLLFTCAEKVHDDIPARSLEMLPTIAGTTAYLNSPFVTAGDRVYMVGLQDGSFPDIGWHIEGEMGGIWNHPVKLLDGFAAALAISGRPGQFCLDGAVAFTNYPMANRHEFLWEQEQLAIERFQFVPDGIEGMVVEFRIRNHGDVRREILFSFTGITDLRPTWLGERTGMRDAPDDLRFDAGLAAVVAKDGNNPWYTAFGSPAKGNFSDAGHGCAPAQGKGLGKTGTLEFPMDLAPGASAVIPVFIAGSYESEDVLRRHYRALAPYGELMERKVDRYEKIRNTARLTIPDKDIGQMYEWLKYNTDWLVRDVPQLGRGISAGLPDYPWWFGADMAYALQGVLATGDHALAKHSIVLLHALSEKTNGNGRIIHEASTNGAVYNPGNVNETAQFISLLHTYYSWTGDKALITRLFPDVKKGIDWLLGEMDPDGNGYPNGSGMMEIPGLDTEMIDVAVYTQQALEAAAEMASQLDDGKTAGRYKQLATALRIKINKEWWNAEEQSFGDFRSTVAGARPVLRAALVRADTLKKAWAVASLKETEKKFGRYAPAEEVAHVIYHNWVVNTPLETGVADVDKGQRALVTSRKYENPFGVYVTGIDRTDEPDSVVLQSRKKTFSYTGAVMTLPTGVQAVAAARYGSPEEALQYLRKLQRSFSYALPGSMYEVSPDFGMVTQAWNIYGVAVPLVQYFFGIQPKAYEQTVYLSPRMPAAWKESALENVTVGDNTLSVVIRHEEDHDTYRITQSLPDWKIIVDIRQASKVLINGEEVVNSGRDTITITGNTTTVQVYR